ncbi:hypothetical protein [Metabacillus arenae]|uniref:Uncharacterized protein n=1 Tax=Metabacillus arenae TaxID=2771434 RepID=A0A926RZF8_9BACI|nr:hypothetical protein [Metabacillus arenae]MBD1379009.1 hypothetical protein [Metabacillus arenae]
MLSIYLPQNGDILRQGLKFFLLNTLYIFLSAAILVVFLFVLINISPMVPGLIIVAYLVFVAFFYFNYWIKFISKFTKYHLKYKPLYGFLISLFGILPNLIYYVILALLVESDPNSCGGGEFFAFIILFLTSITMPFVGLISSFKK